MSFETKWLCGPCCDIAFDKKAFEEKAVVGVGPRTCALCGTSLEREQMHLVSVEAPAGLRSVSAQSSAHGVSGLSSYTIPAKPGWPCPRCGGIGTNADGSFSMGTNPDGSTTVTSREATKCHLCRGKGRVNVTALED